MTEPTKEQSKEELELELKLLKALQLERKIADDLYAIKLVEKIVFGLVGFTLLAVLGAIVALVVK